MLQGANVHAGDKIPSHAICVFQAQKKEMTILSRVACKDMNLLCRPPEQTLQVEFV